MTLDLTALSPAAALAGSLLPRFVLPSLGILLAWAFLGSGRRVARRVPAAVQCWIWWIACLELLVALAPLPGFRVHTPPLLPSAFRLEQPASPVAGERVPVGSAAPARGDVRPAGIASPSAGAARDERAGLPGLMQLVDAGPAILVAVWALGFLAGILGLLLRAIQAARLVAGSRPWSTANAAGATLPAAGGPIAASRSSRSWSTSPPAVDLAGLCRELGLTRVPEVLVSSRVRVPQIVGTMRPRVIVPEGLFDALEPAEKEMALCHELAHIRRKDLFWGWIPCLAVKVLWFHPLARLAAREYQIAREAACDFLVLDVTREAPRSYGRLLLRFSRPARGGVLAGPAGAALSARSLKRRLLLVAERDQSPRRALTPVSVLIVALIGLLPLRFTPDVGAASCPPRSTVAPRMRADRRAAMGRRATGHEVAAIEALVAATMRPAIEAHIAAARQPAIEAQIAAAMQPAIEAHIAAAMADRLPALPITPELLALMGAADRERAASRERRAEAGHDRQDDGGMDQEVGAESLLPTFVFVKKDGHNLSMMGQVNLAETTLERIRRIPADEAIWFHYRDRFYVIVDRPTIEEARRLFGPVERIGNQQSELGRQQAAVGEEQGRIGERQGALAEEQARIGELQAEIMKEMADRREDRPAGDLDERIEELSAELQVLSGEMESLGETMNRLGEMQEKLGRMQTELGEIHERESSKLRAGLIPFVQAAIERGVAQPAE